LHILHVQPLRNQSPMPVQASDAVSVATVCRIPSATNAKMASSTSTSDWMFNVIRARARPTCEIQLTGTQLILQHGRQLAGYRQRCMWNGHPESPHVFRYQSFSNAGRKATSDMPRVAPIVLVQHLQRTIGGVQNAAGLI
jgi:hypothetical protein